MKKELKENKVCIGSWIQTNSAVSAEVLASAGFRWLAVDMEHTESTIADFAEILRAVSKYKVFPMARVTENDTLTIRRCLDCGAGGVIVPLVNSKQDAQRAVLAAKYPPEGVRGFAFTRANEWGEDFDDYAKRANNDVLVIVMIESKAAVENIDEILSVEGVDGVFIGPYDMSGSYGIPGKTDDEIIVAAKNKVLAACKRHGKAAGQHIVIPTDKNVKEAIADGYTFIAVGMDTWFLTSGAKNAMSLCK